MEVTVELAAGDYRLVVAPSRGGSILALTWREDPLLREAAGPGILDAACFPLVPFSNRIAAGRFSWHGQDISLAPNFADVDPYSPIHGFGWLSEWSVVAATSSAVQLVHDHPGGTWPWAYRAELAYSLTGEGLTARLALTNRSGQSMPAGLGFHPYFTRNEATRYHALHHGEWRNDRYGLPSALNQHDDAIDWWEGAAVGSRIVDTVYTDREGPIEITWPDRRLAIQIDPSDNLSSTAVYVPPDAGWFCVEPVSHMTNALNHPEGTMMALQPGGTLAAEMRLQAIRL